MPEFRPIFSEADLPEAAAATPARESNVLDFKNYAAITNDDQRIEIAKDVAAFANADGGTIIYGANETAGVLTGYTPIPTAAEAEALRQAIRDVAKRRCAPPLTLDVRTLPKNAGFVVVANVYSAPGQATGVTLDWQMRTPPGKKVETHFFPVRIGDSTEFMNPEQIAMLMIPQLRRTLSLLRQIDPKATVQVHRQHFEPDPHPDRPAGTAMRLVETNEFANYARFLGVDPTDRATPPIVIPLDGIRLVYRLDERWHVCIDYLSKVSPIT